MNRASVIFSLFPCFFLATLAIAQDGMNHYFVSPTGHDRDAGTKTKPWRTLQHAADQLALGPAGTVVHVATGTYSDMSYCSVEGLVRSHAIVCMQKTGSAEQPIVFQSDEKWGAKLRCTSSGGMFLLLASYIHVVGFDISCSAAGGFAGATYGNNSHNQFHNNYLHDFDLSGCSSVGVLNGNISARPGWNNIGHHVVFGNVIRHAGSVTSTQPECNQAHGLYFGDPYDVLTNNVISGIIGVGIHSYGGGVCYQIISNNTVFDNSQGGIVIENVATSKDYWDECSNGGVSDYNTVTNNIVVNNGIGSSYHGANGGLDDRGGKAGGHNLFANNLVSGNRPQQAALTVPDVAISQRFGLDTSIFTNYQPDPNWNPTPQYDPRNYALKAGGSAIDAGTLNCAPHNNSCAPSTDIIGTPRPQGKAIDIGAFEFLPATSVSKTPASPNQASPR